MFTTVVQFRLPSPITVEEASQRFQSSAPKYVKLNGLVRKHYIVSQDGRVAGGVYHWTSRAAAEEVYSGEWRERVEKLYGSKPEILWFESPVSVDNIAGGTITVDPIAEKTSG
jgi:hypothetical protein